MGPARRALLLANLAVLAALPLAWAAPLMRAGLLPFFGLSEISILSGIAALFGTAPGLACLVALFALVAPAAKSLAMILLLLGRAPGWLLTPVQWLGRLAMADIFLVALYIVLAKGIGMGRVEPAWGLWLFTTLVLASLALSHLVPRRP